MHPKSNIEPTPSNAYAPQDDFELTIARMAKIGSCTSPSFSPDGSRLAFVSDLNGLPQVWAVLTKGGWPELVTTLEDQVLRALWSPTGEWISFSLAPGGGMNRQVYVIRPDGTDLRLLTDGGKENNWLGRWTHDGQKVCIASNRRSADAMDAYLVDLHDDELQMISENRGIGFFTDISRDGEWAILYRLVNRSDDNLFLIQIQTGEEMLLTPHEGPGSFTHGRFSPDGKTIYLTSNKDREMIAFCQIELDENSRPGPEKVILAREDADLQEFEMTKDGNTFALLWNAAGKSEMSFLHLNTREESPAARLPGEIATDLTFSKDGHLLAMVISGSSLPEDIYLYDLQSDQFHPVTHSPHAGIDLDLLIQPELTTFQAHDNLSLSGWLYQPAKGDKPFPVVVSFHGGPEAQERPYFQSLYQALLSQGIAVFAPNVRGSEGCGKTFVNLDNGALRFNAIRDIKSCVDHIVAKGFADPDRIGIMGGSYGGYMTMAGLTEYPDLFVAGANLFGIVNFETFFKHTEPWMAEVSRSQYGDPDSQADLLRRLSPIHKLDRVTAATIVLHGQNDTNVPVVEAEQVVESLKKRGVRVKYVLFPDEGHGFTKETNRVRATTEIVRWFIEHLLTRQ
jgi:dipeptidyl aminopeptidase/acylaminoacyl peptidase